MNILVVGGGSREHALAWKLRQSPLLTDLFIAPGNGGTGAVARNLPVAALDFDGIAAAARAHHVDLVVIGPEDPIAAGLTDRLTAEGFLVYGPSRAAADIEASKAFAKDLMAGAGVPTAAARAFDAAATALAYLDEQEQAGAVPPVVKADGLAAGKGVMVAATYAEARRAVAEAFAGAFGTAGSRVLLEERMSGREVSAHAFCDGTTGLQMVFSCDYKRVGDHDTGANTGGMGAYSPPGFVDAGFAETVQRTVIDPVLRAMAAAGRPFRGTLYPGLMVTDAGPRVVEFNCRFGDPETQVLMPRLESDLLPILVAAARGSLAGVEVRWSPRAAVGVNLASPGYPGPYPTGLPISGLGAVDADVQVFHAGARALEDGTVVTAGGRVLTVVATGDTIAEARERVYDNVRRITFDGVHYRTDIALREVAGA